MDEPYDMVRGYGRCGRCGVTIQHKYEARNELVDGELLMCCPACVQELWENRGVEKDKEKAVAGLAADKFNEELNRMVMEVMQAGVNPLVTSGILQYQLYRCNRVIEELNNIVEKKKVDLSKVKVAGNA